MYQCTKYDHVIYNVEVIKVHSETVPVLKYSSRYIDQTADEVTKKEDNSDMLQFSGIYIVLYPII